MRLLRLIWKKLPYPITHFYQCLNTAPEWHALIKGICLPACRIWRVKTIYYVIEEQHYFMAGVLISTIAMFASVVAVIVWLT